MPESTGPVPSAPDPGAAPRARPGMITRCRACKGVISAAAERCPRCNHPRDAAAPGSGRRRAPSPVWPIILLLVLGGLAFTVSWVSPESVQVLIRDVRSAIAGLPYVSGLPACESAEARSGVSQAMADAPMGRAHGLSIAGWSDIRTLSRGDAEVRCSAVVALSNGQTRHLSYRLYAQDRQILIEANVEMHAPGAPEPAPAR